MTNKEKFLALVAKEETKTVERAKTRLANKKVSKLSNLIAFEILERLDQLNWKQVHLAAQMNVSPQQVNKWVKGNENFTIETLVNLGEVLGIDLIEVKPVPDQLQIVQQQLTMNAAYIAEPKPDFIKPVKVMRIKTTYVDNYALAL